MTAIEPGDYIVGTRKSDCVHLASHCVNDIWWTRCGYDYRAAPTHASDVRSLCGECFPRRVGGLL